MLTEILLLFLNCTEGRAQNKMIDPSSCTHWVALLSREDGPTQGRVSESSDWGGGGCCWLCALTPPTTPLSPSPVCPSFGSWKRISNPSGSSLRGPVSILAIPSGQSHWVWRMVLRPRKSKLLARSSCCFLSLPWKEEGRGSLSQRPYGPWNPWRGECARACVLASTHMRTRSSLKGMGPDYSQASYLGSHSTDICSQTSLTAIKTITEQSREYRAVSMSAS